MDTSQFNKEGLLWKKGRGKNPVLGKFHQPWTLRWFVFDNGLLHYYKPEGLAGVDGGKERRGSLMPDRLKPGRRKSSGFVLKGTILVQDAAVGKADDPDKPFAFYLSNCQSTEDQTYETLYLAAANEEDMVAWMYVLSRGKCKYNESAIINLQGSGGMPITLTRAPSREVSRIRDLYEVGDRLGSGGFSVVKKGVDRTDNSQWALKLIQHTVFQKNRERTEEECKVLASLNHPGIVKLREVVRTAKFFVIVMELLEGGELFDRIVQRKKYHEADAKLVAAHIIDAVRYLHENDIVHRDIKPENLIFDKPGDEGVLKLTDFGFATMYDKKHKLTATCGTPEYVAPEILNEQPYNHSVDMWSVGVVVYILLCGFPPFYGENDDVLFEKICKGKYSFVKPYWDAVSKDAKDLIKHLLELDPTKRYTAQQALEHPWFSDIVGKVDHKPPKEISSKEAESSTDLIGVLGELRRYNAFRKFKKAVLAVIAANKFRLGIESLTGDLHITGGAESARALK